MYLLNLRENMRAVLIVLLVVLMATAIDNRSSSQATTTIKGQIIDDQILLEQEMLKEAIKKGFSILAD